MEIINSDLKLLMIPSVRKIIAAQSDGVFIAAIGKVANKWFNGDELIGL